MATATPQVIAVDLTPVLPGGENGGAKIFVLELLKGLAELAPATQFVLFTQAAAHEELAHLDRPNMRRQVVIGQPGMEHATRTILQRIATKSFPFLPRRVHAGLGRLGYRLDRALKRSASSSLLHRIGADLLFCPFTAPTYHEAGIPTICTIYDLQYKTHPDFFAPEDVVQRNQTFVEACRRATGLAAISEYSRRSAIEHGKLDEDRIRTIHLHMARRHAGAASAAPEALERFGLAAGRYFICPANFWPHKNHEMLLTAFGMACHKGLAGDISLVCTGAPGKRQEWLEEAARRMDLGGRVVFPGYVSHEDLAALMSQALGMVFPSLYEGFGLPVIEAMAVGVPVACSNTTSLPEVAGDAAYLFDPRIPSEIAGAMVALANDAVLRERLVAAGHLRAEEFSQPAQMVNAYWDLFRFAMSSRMRQDLLTGVFEDGWAGPALHIQIAPSSGPRTLEFVFFAPDWLPRDHVTIEARTGGKRVKEALIARPGSRTAWSLPVAAPGGHWEIRMSPTFHPARAGIGDDQRELSVMLERCSLTDADGVSKPLFVERTSA